MFATASLDGKPNNISKLILKVEDNFIYLIDYSIEGPTIILK